MVDILFIYAVLMGLSMILNGVIGTRIPRSIYDFLKLTFLPYVLYYWITDKDQLTDD